MATSQSPCVFVPVFQATFDGSPAGEPQLLEHITSLRVYRTWFGDLLPSDQIIPRGTDPAELAEHVSLAVSEGCGAALV